MRSPSAPTLFVSDVHLSAHRPRAVDLFKAFLAGPARGAQALYILGDLFDEWLGDDDRRPPHPDITQALRETVEAGLPIWVVHGNHDFLLGEGFSEETGCELIREQAVIELAGKPALIMHGDSLCTRDEDYMRFRVYSRDPKTQREFLAMPFDARAAQAAELRRQSRALMREKSDEIMDVTDSAVSEVMLAHGVHHLVHGHTHRPGINAFELQGEPAQRVVLGDWYEQDSVLRWDQTGAKLGRIGDLHDLT